MRLGDPIVSGPDVAASVAFYERAFGLAPRFVRESGQYAELETGATARAFAEETFVAQTCPGIRPNRGGEAPAGFEVGLVAEDVPAAFARAVAAGAVPATIPPCGEAAEEGGGALRDHPRLPLGFGADLGPEAACRQATESFKATRSGDWVGSFVIARLPSRPRARRAR